ncbi:MAG: hypothetical protein AB1487_10230 [Thermodesulfobacteriota bacterium]
MGSEAVFYDDLGIPTVGAPQTLTGRVRDFLKDKERVLSHLTPKYILDRTLRSDEDVKEMRAIYDVFLKTPGMPIVESMDVLLSAVRSGVEAGLLGVKIDGKVYFNEPVYSLSSDVEVLRPERARELKAQAEAGAVYSEGEGGGKAGEVGETATLLGKEEARPVAPGKSISELRLRARIPWDKISSIISGVIRPLKDSGSEPEIVVEIKARSKEGFDRTTLDSKVKETLQQLGANIEEWKEE